MDQHWIGALVIGGIVIVFAVCRLIQFFEQYKILQNGVRVVGRIIKHRKQFMWWSGVWDYEYYVTLRYEYEGKTYTPEEQVSKKIYLTYPDQTKVNVHFMPDDPTRVVMKIV